ncbi:sigma factor-like helix-turn-helix DNA-binding protein, partial [Phocaeicola sartorii]
QEIANELGISIKTVEHQISKALKALRETAIKVYTFFFG